MWITLQMRDSQWIANNSWQNETFGLAGSKKVGYSYNNIDDLFK